MRRSLLVQDVNRALVGPGKEGAAGRLGLVIGNECGYCLRDLSEEVKARRRSKRTLLQAKSRACITYELARPRTGARRSHPQAPQARVTSIPYPRLPEANRNIAETAGRVTGGDL
ncbi:hypothetical protein GGTG_14013 [Gaeumannomyces tritici R3-111a-1]|uniref:Uncharacterized protein n=1 Tax=Gaeumannomyces tritici (strain R3-111a-1) TaxID=644352 RepID=J3PKF9_GAET3|nr:hypothetical protein GGTG_14013 [Gaeumannomyces tritici R3-111a-1]EJT68412.1 hypothetical protein GGTG_14013 [Gaeumannomyces tritici R3-111a-1]